MQVANAEKMNLIGDSMGDTALDVSSVENVPEMDQCPKKSWLRGIRTKALMGTLAVVFVVVLFVRGNTVSTQAPVDALVDGSVPWTTDVGYTPHGPCDTLEQETKNEGIDKKPCHHRYNDHGVIKIATNFKLRDEHGKMSEDTTKTLEACGIVPLFIDTGSYKCNFYRRNNNVEKEFISDDQIECLFNHDMREARSCAKEIVGVKKWKLLHPEAKSVAVDLAFDQGCENLASGPFQSFFDALHVSDYHGARKALIGKGRTQKLKRRLKKDLKCMDDAILAVEM